MKRRDPKIVSASSLTDIVAISRDGLMIRADGTFVRALRVGAANPLVLNDDQADRVSSGLSSIAARLESGQSIQFYVSAQPVPLSEVIDEGRQASAVAVEDAVAAGEKSRAAAMRGLAIAAEQSIASHCAEIAAMAVTYYVICPYNPGAGSLSSRTRPFRSSVVSMTRRDALRAAAFTLEFAEGVRKDLESMDIPASFVGGAEFAQLIAQRLSGSALEVAGAAMAVDTVDGDELIELLMESEAEEFDPRFELAQSRVDFSAQREVLVGDDVEHVTYMSEIPESTWLGQPLQLMQIPSPFVYSVFVRATNRVRERNRYRQRFRRIRGMNIGRERRGAHVSIESELQEREAESVLADLTTTIGSGIFEVSTYIAVRGLAPNPDRELVNDSVARIRREATGSSDARFSDGLMAQRPLWLSTLPIGRDVGNRRRRFVSRNVGDLVPLVGCSFGSPSGVPLGYSSPGRTLERINPFDPVHENHLVLITGKSGSGKTMGTNVLLSRWIARGAQGFIVDRAGHYDFLCDLVPGAASLSIGPGAADFSVNPWDVDDIDNVPGDKIAFLLDLHALLIGAHDAGADSNELQPLESNVLEGAIRAVYGECARKNAMPREGILQRILFEEAEAARDSIYKESALSLAYRLQKYVGDGTYAYLADRPTNVPTDSPLTVFDTRAIPRDMIGATIMLVSEFVLRKVRDRFNTFADGQSGRSEWSGRSFLIIDEAWAYVLRRQTGEWFNELARRARHIALCIVAISQQLADFSGEYGSAIRQNASIRIYYRQSKEDLEFAQASQDYSDAEVELMKGLRTVKRDYATAYVHNGARGKGIVTQSYGDIEYWMATSDPVNDEPVRRRALRDGDGKPWRALQLLADVSWHASLYEERAEASTPKAVA